MRPVHPGEILKEEIETLGLSARAFASALDVPPNRVTAILNEDRAVSADTALRLARFFGNSPKFWLNLQASYELAVAERDAGDAIALVRTAQEVSKAARPLEEIASVLDDDPASRAPGTPDNAVYSQAAEQLSKSVAGLAEPIHAFAKMADPVSEVAKAMKLLTQAVAEDNAELAALSRLAAPLEDLAKSMRRLERPASVNAPSAPHKKGTGASRK